MTAALRRRGWQKLVFVLEMLACAVLLATAIAFSLAGDGLVRSRRAALPAAA